jgi:multidrug efflux pump subunit AcrB
VLLDACFLRAIAGWIKNIPVLGEISTLTSSQGWFAVSMLFVAGSAVVASLVWAWLRRPHPTETRDSSIMRIYSLVLRATLIRGMRWIIVALAIGSFAIALKGMASLPSDFVPEADEGRILASVELPPGSSLDETVSTTNEIANALKADKDIKSVFVIGGSSAASSEVRRASLVIGLVAKTDRTRSQKEIQYLVSHILAGIPDIRFSFDSQEKVAVVGDDGAKVAKAALNLEEAMSRDPIFVNPMALASFSSPELRIIPKLAMASDVGVTPSQISDTIRIATTGAQQSDLANFTIDGRQIPIRVELDRNARSSLDILSALRVPRSNGSSVPLSSVADMSWGEGPATIDRYDRQRLVNVGFDVPKGFTSGQASDRVPEMDVVKNFPSGVGLQATGNAEEQNQMFAQFGLAMGSGILLVFLVLILLFRNVFHPLAILSAMPLSVCGVIAALTLSQSAFSLSVTIGLLMLMGIVIKNTIMLVDFAVERARDGVPRKEAIIDACRKRARPIIMTTIAMIAGMLPAAAGVGAGGELRAPMAIAVIGGLLASTVLSLLFIPAIYTIMDDISLLFAWAFRRIVQPNLADDAVVNRRHSDDILVFEGPTDGSRFAAE